MLLTVRKLILFSLAVLITVLMLLGGCVFSNKETGSDPGWKKVSMPSYLKGSWYHNNYLEFVITSSRIDASNRDWVLDEIATKSDTVRVIGRSSHEYMAFYFASFSGNRAASATGIASSTLFESKIVSDFDWIIIEKKGE